MSSAKRSLPATVMPRAVFNPLRSSTWQRSPPGSGLSNSSTQVRVSTQRPVAGNLQSLVAGAAARGSPSGTMSSEKRRVKRVIVPSPVPELPGVASVTCGTVSAVAVAAIARLRGRISASFALAANIAASPCQPVFIAPSPRINPRRYPAGNRGCCPPVAAYRERLAAFQEKAVTAVIDKPDRRPREGGGRSRPCATPPAAPAFAGATGVYLASIGPSFCPAKIWTWRCGTSWWLSSPVLASRR